MIRILFFDWNSRLALIALSLSLCGGGRLRWKKNRRMLHRKCRWSFAAWRRSGGRERDEVFLAREGVGKNEKRRENGASLPLFMRGGTRRSVRAPPSTCAHSTCSGGTGACRGRRAPAKMAPSLLCPSSLGRLGSPLEFEAAVTRKFQQFSYQAGSIPRIVTLTTWRQKRFDNRTPALTPRTAAR